MSDAKTVSARALEIFGGDLAIADEVIADDYVGYDAALPEPTRGPEGVKAAAAGYRAAFPDVRFTIDQQIAEGEWVATRWTGTGTHEGELFGVAPTGKTASASGITIERVVDGKIVEGYTVWDTLGLMVQLGAVPAPQTAQV